MQGGPRGIVAGYGLGSRRVRPTETHPRCFIFHCHSFQVLDAGRRLRSGRGGWPWGADVTGKRVIPPTTDDEPSTPEFIKEALEAGFTLELLSRAENAFNSGSTPSSSDLKLANSIVSKMVERKIDGRPWQGPLPPPRVSPPRTFGDALAAATYQRRSSSHRRLTRTSRTVGSLARSGPAGKTTNSNYFESPKFQDLDPLFPPLPCTMLPASAACVTTGATEKSAQGFLGLADRACGTWVRKDFLAHHRFTCVFQAHRNPSHSQTQSPT